MHIPPTNDHNIYLKSIGIDLTTYNTRSSVSNPVAKVKLPTKPSNNNNGGTPAPCILLPTNNNAIDPFATVANNPTYNLAGVPATTPLANLPAMATTPISPISAAHCVINAPVFATPAPAPITKPIPIKVPVVIPQTILSPPPTPRLAPIAAMPVRQWSIEWLKQFLLPLLTFLTQLWSKK